jgi:hypothetical protein
MREKHRTHLNHEALAERNERITEEEMISEREMACLVNHVDKSGGRNQDIAAGSK